ncbi:MAG: hypothetical protein JO122_07130 [Acetobacteraceae bacterium]|nr:hypothetical protein [Acetobacteraceae bacterium]
MRSHSAAFRGLLAGLIGMSLAVAASSGACADPPWGWHHGWNGGWDHHWHPHGWWYGRWWGPRVYYAPPPVYYAPPPPAYYAPPPGVTFGFAFR